MKVRIINDALFSSMCGLLADVYVCVLFTWFRGFKKKVLASVFNEGNRFSCVGKLGINHGVELEHEMTTCHVRCGETKTYQLQITPRRLFIAFLIPS